MVFVETVNERILKFGNEWDGQKEEREPGYIHV